MGNRIFDGSRPDYAKRRDLGDFKRVIYSETSSWDVCGASALYRPGNRIACIFENPEEKEKKLRHPVVGQTGINFYLLTCFCRELNVPWLGFGEVTIINARYKKTMSPDKFYVDFVKNILFSKDVIICFGKKAEQICSDIEWGNFSFADKCVIKIVHLSAQGLAHIVSKDKGGIADYEKLRCIAKFIHSTGFHPGVYGDDEFKNCNNKITISR